MTVLRISKSIIGKRNQTNFDSLPKENVRVLEDIRYIIEFNYIAYLRKSKSIPQILELWENSEEQWLQQYQLID